MKNKTCQNAWQREYSDVRAVGALSAKMADARAEK